MEQSTCAIPQCNRTFAPSPNKKYCSHQCAMAARNAARNIRRRAANRAKMPPACTECGGPIPATLRANAVYCGTACADNAWVKTRAERRRQRSTTPATMQCTRCGQTVEWKPGRKYCTDCSTAALREARYRCRVKYKHKLRELAVDTFDPQDIFERDRWTCSLCDQPIDQHLRHPDPMSASIDHVIPVSLGGAHSATNVAAAHLVCNLRKGDRVAEAAPGG